MALNNRIYKYTCDICNRSIERFADPARPDPLRCVITDNCNGKLKLTNTRFGLRPLSTPTVVGLLDRAKRGTPKSSLATSPPLDRINLSSFSGSNGLTLAVLKSIDTIAEREYVVFENGVPKTLARTSLAALLPSDVTITAVLFELTPAALEYKRYTYVRTERCVYVQGKDDSAAQGQLTFDSLSNVRVFVNGKLVSSSTYDKANNTITFTPELEEPSLLIEVFVYKSLSQFFSEDQAIRLSFTALSQYDSMRSGSAWGDVSRVDQFIPLYCPDVSALDKSRSYGLVRLEATDETSTLISAIDQQGYFLLAAPPYAFQDKRLTAVVPITAFTSEGYPLSFNVNSETGDTNAVVDGETLSPLSRPLAFSTVNTNTPSSTDTVGLVVARKEKTFIIGPA